MARVTEPFAEEVHYMKALYQEYNKRNDADTVAAVEQEVSDIIQTCSATEADVRQTIKEMSRQVQELEGVAAYPHRAGLHAERIAALQRQIDLAKQDIDEMDTQTRSADQQCKKVEERLEQVAASAKEAAASYSKEETFLKSELSMYKHITSTRFYTDDGGVISGAVSDAVSKDIRTFSFPLDVDKFEMVNKLWDLL